MHLDHNDKAEEEYRRLERSEMKKKDHLLLVYDNYGHLLAQQNRVDEVTEIYTKAALVAPEVWWHHANLGHLRSLKGTYDKALIAQVSRK